MASLRSAFAVPIVVACVACGGAVASSAAGPGVDASAGDASVEAAPDASAGEDAPAGCPADPNAAIGTPCAPEGQSCGGPCSDPCSFCNLVSCQGGVWTAVEVTPLPCVDAGAVQPLLTWQAPGGFAGTGPALAVEADGTVLVWSTLPGFDPQTVPSSPPTSTFQVSSAQAADLYTRWTSTSLAGLPHGTPGAECYATVWVRACSACTPGTLSYQQAAQVTPEMNDVWSWFDANLPANVAAAHPSSYCHF